MNKPNNKNVELVDVLTDAQIKKIAQDHFWSQGTASVVDIEKAIKVALSKASSSLYARRYDSASTEAVAGEPVAWLQKGIGGVDIFRLDDEIAKLPQGNHKLYTARTALANTDVETVAWAIPATRQFSWEPQDERFWTPLIPGKQSPSTPEEAECQPGKWMRTIGVEVSNERERQDALWGGADADDDLPVAQFIQFIYDQFTVNLQKDLLVCKNDGDVLAVYRDRFLKAAALAVAALESIDRRAAS